VHWIEGRNFCESGYEMTEERVAPSRPVVVTGGSRGLGRNVAVNIAKNGFDVIITYQTNEAAAKQVVKEITELGRKASALKLDTSDVASFDGFSASLRADLAQRGIEHIFGLVNNAGIGLDAPFADTSEEVFDRLLNIHLKGVFFLTQKLLPIISEGGRIVNVSSALARVSLPGYAAYGTAKAAVETLTRYLAKELGPRKITANVLVPGGVETDFGGGALRDIPEVNAFIASQTALGRAGVPDDIGPVVAALLSDSHRWVTGQRIEVSGGWQL
jgi:NAD(P)-dependent dehydrogenase (short-subunit alcohol dehydrogenase family)